MKTAIEIPYFLAGPAQAIYNSLSFSDRLTTEDIFFPDGPWETPSPLNEIIVRVKDEVLRGDVQSEEGRDGGTPSP